MRKSVVFLIALAMLLTMTTALIAKNYEFQAIPENGIQTLMLGIQKLPVFGNIMLVGAHPDDEDNNLIVYTSKGLNLNTYYLVANWGEGGQNEIGPELYEALGVLRSQELASARAIDGGVQLYLGVYDFGFSKTGAESFEKWGYEKPLENFVRIIRTYKPDIMFTNHDTVSGHGHHQAIGQLILVAFDAAADPAMFPEQLSEEGLQTWQVKKLYVSNSKTPTLKINVGDYNEILGYSYAEIGGLARSSHKCQGMGGNFGPKGEYIRNYLLTKSAIGFGEEETLLDGVDTSLKAISAGIEGNAETISAIDGALIKLNGVANRVVAGFNAFSPLLVADDVLEGLATVRELKVFVEKSDLAKNAKALLLERLASKEADFLAVSRNLFSTSLDVASNDVDVVPGQSFEVTATFWNRGGSTVDGANVEIMLPEGWSSGTPSQTFGSIGHNEKIVAKFAVTVGKNAAITGPYDDAPLSVVANWDVMGSTVWTETSPELRVVPTISIAMEPEKIMVPKSDSSTVKTLSIKLKNNSKEAVKGSVSLSIPKNWSLVTADTSFEIAAEGQETSVQVEFKVPANATVGESTIEAVAQVAGESYAQGYHVIAYPHIDTKYYYKPATARVAIIEVAVAPGLKVGYVDSGFDLVANYLKEMGVDVTLLSANDLATGDLSQYDTIITGIRAYLSRPDLIANNARLLEYVYNGGNMIVQYNKTPEWRVGKYSPYDITLSSNRVTVEEAEIKVLVPESPIFNTPNKIGPSDWEGWIQERGLYFPSKWAPEFTPLIDTDDPNEDVPAGSFLIANYGKGTYIYTALVWYRQIDDLVPGGYRVFANMISLPKLK